MVLEAPMFTPTSTLSESRESPKRGTAQVLVPFRTTKERVRGSGFMVGAPASNQFCVGCYPVCSASSTFATSGKSCYQCPPRQSYATDVRGHTATAILKPSHTLEALKSRTSERPPFSHLLLAKQACSCILISEQHLGPRILSIQA